MPYFVSIYIAQKYIDVYGNNMTKWDKDMTKYESSCKEFLIFKMSILNLWCCRTETCWLTFEAADANLAS